MLAHVNAMGLSAVRTSRLDKFGGQLLCLLTMTLMAIMFDRFDDLEFIEQQNAIDRHRTIQSFSEANCWNIFAKS
jgi:hypothetical protein